MNHWTDQFALTAFVVPALIILGCVVHGFVTILRGAR